MWNEIDQHALAQEENAWAGPRSPEDVEQIVVLARLDLYNRALPCGAAALRRELREYYHLQPLPSIRKIAAILRLYGLTYGRTGWYEGEELDWLPASARVPQSERRALSIGRRVAP